MRFPLALAFVLTIALCACSRDDHSRDARTDSDLRAAAQDTSQAARELAATAAHDARVTADKARADIHRDTQQSHDDHQGSQ